jgi:hypothetical protein
MCVRAQGAQQHVPVPESALPAAGVSLDGPLYGQLLLPGHLPSHENLPLRPL